MDRAFGIFFYADVKDACARAGFEDTIFADDLNAFLEVASVVSNDILLGWAGQCQVEVHAWGVANGVSFEPTKESMHIISRHEPAGDNFDLLGVTYDTKLTMEDEVSRLASECSWKTTQLLRVGSFYDAEQLILLYKQQVLSYVEYRTAAIYHAADTVLEPLEAVQNRILRAVGISEIDALIHMKLAPLRTRRDIAVLGIIHRTVLGRGPELLKSIIKIAKVSVGYPLRTTRLAANRHRLQVEEKCEGSHTDYLMRSLAGAISIYNLLPPYIVEDAPTVPKFQGKCQALVLERAKAGFADWSLSLSPRLPRHCHPLLSALM